jgi:hypothetical protein
MCVMDLLESSEIWVGILYEGMSARNFDFHEKNHTTVPLPPGSCVK